MKLLFEPFASIQQALKIKTEIDLIKKYYQEGNWIPLSWSTRQSITYFHLDLTWHHLSFLGSISQDSLKIRKFWGNIGDKEKTSHWAYHQILIKIFALNHLAIILQLYFPSRVFKCKKHIFKAKGDEFGYYWAQYFGDWILIKNKWGHAFIHWLPINSMPIDRMTFYPMPFYTTAK